MKCFFFVLFLSFVGLQARQEENLIRQVNKLLLQAPTREDFLNSITFIPENQKNNLLDLSKKLSPRLYATLLRAKTSLGFTDNELKQKLYSLILEQDLLDALEAKNLVAAFEAIEKGADVNIATESGHTALMLAILQADQSAVQDLLRRGAKQNVKGEFMLDGQTNPHYMTPLALAQQLDYQPIAQVLKKAL